MIPVQLLTLTHLSCCYRSTYVKVIFLDKSTACIRKIPNEVKLALQARMSQILFQIWDKLGLDDFEFDITLLQTRQAKVFASVVVLVPVAYCVVETCRFLWKIRYVNTLLSKFYFFIFQYNPVADPGFPSGGAPTPKVGALTYYFPNFVPKTA